ncbi:MAG: 50S ribosomal protein L30 [Clostridia bacterium]|nr:50S ribosomal protein L30 [Clostridia bacterium]
MAKIKVTLVKSTIGCKQDQIATVKALGLKKIRDEKIHEDNARIKGMINKVCHLVSVEQV